MVPSADDGERPLRIGLIADVQYADREDGTDFDGSNVRRYRNALRVAEAAVDCWNAQGVEVVIQLGDLIDGCNARMGASSAALATMLRTFGRCTARERYDLIGNHELYNVRREDLPTSGLRCQDSEGSTYWSAPLGPHWEAVFLDTYEHSLNGVPAEHPGFQKAWETLATFNPTALEGDSADWFGNVPEDLHRFVPYNGAASSEQVAWLDRALAAAARAGRSVLVFTHVPLYIPATKSKTVPFNAEEILDVLHNHKDTVVAVLAGHDHDGGYAVDPAGLHHVTMNSPLNVIPGSDCFAILDLRSRGRAHFLAYGRACVESSTKGKGRAYSELVLAKGVQNLPTMPPLEQPPTKAPANGKPLDAAQMRAARLAALDRKPGGGNTQADPSSVATLVAMGFTADAARHALEASQGNVEAATRLLLG